MVKYILTLPGSLIQKLNMRVVVYLIKVSRREHWFGLFIGPDFVQHCKPLRY